VLARLARCQQQRAAGAVSCAGHPLCSGAASATAAPRMAARVRAAVGCARAGPRGAAPEPWHAAAGALSRVSRGTWR
jgi:hypothetical protein